MKRLKIILKGVLLWVTAFAVMLFISGVDSIYDNGYFIHSIIVCAVLCYTCYKLISEEDAIKAVKILGKRVKSLFD
nr:MAG TPA: hypothetical protein [Crassvirales sp.]